MTASQQPSGIASLLPSVLRRVWLAVITIFLLFGGLMRRWTDEENRFYMHWERRYAIILILLVLGLSAVAVLVDEILRRYRLRRMRRAYSRVFLLTALLGIATCLPVGVPTVNKLFCIFGLLAVAYLWGVERSIRLMKAGLYTISLLVPILFVQMLCWPNYATPVETPHFRRTADRKRPFALVLLFDEWSQLRSAPDGEYLPTLRNTRSLCEESFVFRQALSAGGATKESVPQFLLQAYGRLQISGRQAFLEEGGRLLPTREGDGILGLARNSGYNTAVVGFYFPYRFMLGSRADYAVSFASEYQGQTWMQTATTLAIETATTWPVPAFASLAEGMQMGLKRQYHRDISAETFRRVSAFIRGAPQNTFMFVHWNVPHCLFTFDADGTPRDGRDHNPDDYMRQLGYADTLLGRVIKELRETGRYDDALIVVTSDHSWRADPDPRITSGRLWRFRVPFIVKWPRQRRQFVIDREISLTEIRPLMECALRGGSEQDAIDAIRSLRPPSPRPLH